MAPFFIMMLLNIYVFQLQRLSSYKVTKFFVIHDKVWAQPGNVTLTLVPGILPGMRSPGGSASNVAYNRLFFLFATHFHTLKRLTDFPYIHVCSYWFESFLTYSYL